MKQPLAFFYALAEWQCERVRMMTMTMNGSNGALAASILDMPEPTPAHYAAHERHQKAYRDWYAEDTLYKDILEGRATPGPIADKHFVPLDYP